MNLKRIIREEINDMEWINDIKSNKDIAEELFKQTVITKDKGIVKFPFMTSNIHPKKYYFDPSIKKRYGKDRDSDDIWERYKVLVNNRLKELRPKNLKESNDMEWIKDVEVDELILSPYISFRDDDEMRDIVKNFVDDTDDIDEDLLFNLATDQGYRWSEKHQGWWHSSERVNPKSIKESNCRGWVYESMPTLNDALYNRLLKVGDIVTLSGWLVDLDHNQGVSTDNFKIKIEELGNGISSSYFTPLQEKYWGHLGYMDEPLRFTKEDGMMLVVSIE